MGMGMGTGMGVALPVLLVTCKDRPGSYIQGTRHMKNSVSWESTNAN